MTPAQYNPQPTKKMKLAITHCEKCGREEKGKHDERACPRCQAGPGLQFVRWVDSTPIPAARPFAGVRSFGGVTGEKW
jgi:hypothetical protein